jgi:MoaA/NifB/PqqE/SkfB family radical SAM enzyme
MLKSAVWFTTMACNFKCNYCWEVQAQERGDFKPLPFKTADEWINAWTKLRPGILDITGGEPFLQPGLIDIIKSIAASGTKVAMTSNFSHPILDFVRQVNPNDILSLTASYHPSQNGSSKLPMNEDIFFGRLLLLREFGFNNVTVNIVAWPEQFWLIPKFIELCERHKLRWHVDPYSSIAYYPWEFTEPERLALTQWVTPQRTITERDRDCMVTCSGGIDHISVQPDGTAWRCILERQQNKNPLGNILDPEFTLANNKPSLCDQRQNCPGCDKDKVSVIYHERKNSLPILY